MSRPYAVGHADLDPEDCQRCRILEKRIRALEARIKRREEMDRERYERERRQT